ncbi:MAG TPA: hypothetical protein VGL94_02325 [Ktedonobacteraceae bacterium]
MDIFFTELFLQNLHRTPNESDSQGTLPPPASSEPCLRLSTHTAQAHRLKETMFQAKSSPIGLLLGSICKVPLAPNFSLDKSPSHHSLGDAPGSRQPPFSVSIALSAQLCLPVPFRLAAFAS